MGSSSLFLNRVHISIVYSGLLDNIHDPFDLGKDPDNGVFGGLRRWCFEWEALHIFE